MGNTGSDWAGFFIVLKINIKKIYLNTFILSGKKTISEDHAWGLAKALTCYGLEIDGWRFSYDQEGDTFFLEKKMDKQSELIDHKTWIEYKVSVCRDFISDDQGLIRFLRENNK